jgi:hypothetical protein
MFILVFILVFTVVIPIAWIISEFHDRRWLRLTLGVSSILLSIGVAVVIGSFERFNSNAWFGNASKRLINTTISEIEAGHEERVLRSLKRLQLKYEPTYENRAQYDQLVDETVKEMRSDK